MKKRTAALGPCRRVMAEHLSHDHRNDPVAVHGCDPRRQLDAYAQLPSERVRLLGTSDRLALTIWPLITFIAMVLIHVERKLGDRQDESCDRKRWWVAVLLLARRGIAIWD